MSFSSSAGPLRPPSVAAGRFSLAGRLWPALLAVAFLAVTTFYNFTYPLWEGSDEPQQFEQIRYLARDHALPRPVSWATTAVIAERNMSHHPPLYYALEAALVGWLMPGGEGPAWHANPFVTWPDHPAAQALAVHTPDESFPYSRAVWAGHAARLVSSLLGLLLVLAAYLLARQVLRPGPALFAAALVAFTPGVVYLAATVNNEIAAAAFAGLALALAVRFVRQGGSGLRYGLLVGGLAALAGLSKLTGYYVVPLALLAGLLAPSRPQVGSVTAEDTEGAEMNEAVGMAAVGRSANNASRSALSANSAVKFGLSARLLYLALVVGLPALAAGAWYWSARADWDLIIENSELTSVGAAASAGWLLTPFDPSAWPRLAWALPRLFASYWGVFGPVSDAFRLPEPLYWALAALVVLALAGLALYLGREYRRRPAVVRSAQALVLLAVLALGYAVIARSAQARTAGALDGRHLLAIAGALSALLAGGLAYVVPGRWRLPGAVLVLAGLLATGISVPLSYAAVVRLPAAAVVAGTPGVPAARAVWANGLSLLDLSLPLADLHPGQSVPATLRWQAGRRLGGDFQVALLAVARDGKPYLFYQAVPLLATLPPRAWLPGDVVTHRFELTVPAGMPLGRARLEVHVVQSGGAGDPIARSDPSLKPLLEWGTIDILPPAVAPNAVERQLGATLGSNLQLAGYGPAQLRAVPGSALALRLYWQALAPLPEDYVVSLQLLDAKGALAAQADAPPRGGAYPTSQWPQGLLVADERTLSVPVGLAAGQYELRAIVYRYPSLERLRLPANLGGGDYAVLGRVDIAP